MSVSRKDKRNFGGTFASTQTPYFDGPPVAQVRTNIVLVERVLLAVLRTEVERLRQDRDETERFFSHFFDPVAGPAERAAFVDNFINEPPTTVIGYPRTGGDFPCFAIILEGEEETDNMVGDYVGQTVEGEVAKEAAEYVGAIFEHAYGIYIYAQHPDVCAYLYQFAKMVLFGAKAFLEECGLIEPHFSGAELSPEEVYLPDNMYARALRVKAQAVMSIPVLLSADPGRIRLAGLFGNDITVDGFSGGVTTYVPGAGSNDEE